MTNNKLEGLTITEVKGLQDVKVFRVCECDAVAAYTQDEATAWYKKLTGLKDEELYDYDEVEILPLDAEYWYDEERTHKRTLTSMIEERWEGQPFIALTWEM
jgi:hypothetical protein